MFRIQDNVPSVYINESRDFQLLARLYDTLFSGVKYDIDTIVNVIDAMQCSDNMLELLATKVGFFPRIHIDSNVLKYIISGFPQIIKNKGNIDGITQAVQTVLKAENRYTNTSIRIDFDNTSRDEQSGDIQPYFGTIVIYVNLDEYNKRALKEVLRYVIPFGFICEIKKVALFSDANQNPDVYYSRDGFTNVISLKTLSSQVRTSSDIDAYNEPFKRVLNAYSMGQIITSSDDAKLIMPTKEIVNASIETDDGDIVATQVMTNDGGDYAPAGTKYNTTIITPITRGKKSRKK